MSMGKRMWKAQGGEWRVQDPRRALRKPLGMAPVSLIGNPVCVARAAEVRHGAETAGWRYLYPLSIKSVDTFDKLPPQIGNARVPEFLSHNKGLHTISLTREVG